MKKLVILDAHAIIHRAFHAMPPLTAPDGAPVNAVYGFASILLKILKDLKPDYAVCAFDHEGPTFRHLAFERYKAQREEGPDELYRQIPAVKELVAAFGMPSLEKQGYEADDLIGTVAHLVRHKNPDVEIIIVTGDLDTLQLIDEKTKVFTMRKGVTDTVLYDGFLVKERYGLDPAQMVDYKGLRGDPSDNIPGVKGIGEKTAAELLKAHGSIENIYKALKKGALETRPAVKETLKKCEADALFSKTLATIDCRVPVDFVLAAARLRKTAASQEKIKKIFEHFGFYSLLRRLDGNNVVSKHVQAGLTDSKQGEVQVKRVNSLAAVKPEQSAVVLGNPKEKEFLISVGGNLVYKLSADKAGLGSWSNWLKAARRVYVFDLKNMLSRGFPDDTRRVCDLMLIWWLLEPGRRTYESDKLAIKEGSVSGDITQETTAAALFRIAPAIEKKLDDEKLRYIYDEIESPLVAILREMEEAGIGFNPGPIVKLAKKMKEELAALEEEIYSVAGAPFNINSSRKLGEVLFEKLKLASQGVRKTEKSGFLSTRESELTKLRNLHPIVDKILRWREVAKIRSTYVDTLPKMVRDDGRIHTTWNQTGTATGRLSSQDPNLQNIPIRSEFGREIRRAFIAAKGFQLAAFDYSQLELRIVADLSQDEKMINAFKRGVDIHRLTASEINKVPLEKVTPEMRSRAKTLNFGVLYGMGRRALAETAGISQGEAELFIEEYFRNFKGVARFINETKEFARTHGYTITAFGRKRFFPEMSSTNFRVQREVERQAFNHPIQGTEADIMKKAMIAVHDFLKKKKLLSDARLLLQIHDELIFEVKKEIPDDVLGEVKDIMEKIWSGEVPMVVEIKKGKSWIELE